MPKVSGLNTNRTNSPNISSLILFAGDLILIVAQSVSVVVTLFSLRNPLQI